MPLDFNIPARGSWDVMNKKTPRERLLMLRDFLRTPAPHRFWDFGNVEVNPECGTSGCAIGWYGYLTGREADDLYDMAMYETAIYEDEGPDEFGISIKQASRIFGTGLGCSLHKRLGDVTPTDVADAIDRYLEAPA